MFQLVEPDLEVDLAVRLPEEAGVFEPRLEHALPPLLDQGHVLGLQVQGGQEVRQQLAVRPLHAEALLVRLHGGQQDLARQLQIQGSDIADDRLGILHQVGDLVEQAIHPDDLAAQFLGQPVALGHDGLLALFRIDDDLAVLLDHGEIFPGGRHGERSRPHDPVAPRLPAGGHVLHGELHHVRVQQGEQPADGTPEGEIIAAPMHFLGKGEGFDRLEADRGQDVSRLSAAHDLVGRQVFALVRSQGVQGVLGHSLGLGKARARLGQVAVLVIGDAGSEDR